MKELPELHQAELDDATIEQLLADLSALTEVIEVRIKGDVRTYAEDQEPSLGEGFELLRTGRVRGLQVCYVYDNAQWQDTLIRTPTSTRVVRVRHEMSEDCPPSHNTCSMD